MPPSSTNPQVEVVDFRISLGDIRPSDVQLNALRAEFLPVLNLLFKQWQYQLEDSFLSPTSEHFNVRHNYHFQGYGKFDNRRLVSTATSGIREVFTTHSIHTAAASTLGRVALEKYTMKSLTRVDGPWDNRPVDLDEYKGEDLPTESTLRPWQRTLLNMIRQPAGDRKIMWVYDPIGGAGKSKFTKFMAWHKYAFPLQYGKSSDLSNLIVKNMKKKCYIFDLTRCKPADFAGSDVYSVMESCKNGMIQNTKYQTSNEFMKSPHVIVFSNCTPDFSSLSSDRWELYTIAGGGLIPLPHFQPPALKKSKRN